MRVRNGRTGLMTEETLGSVVRATTIVSDGYVGVLAGCYETYWRKLTFQVATIIQNLFIDPTSRREVAFLDSDPRQDFWPCLSLVQFMIRERQLICIFYWRSSSDAEREGDERFMRWVARWMQDKLNVVGSLSREVKLIVFRGSDHEVLVEGDGRP